jgi:hypothetical protein
MPTLRNPRLRFVLLALAAAATLAADTPFNYQELFHRGAILRAVDPGWPAWRYRREIVDVDPGGTRALVHTTPILSCANSSGSTFDIWLVRRDGWWWIESLKQAYSRSVDC